MAPVRHEGITGVIFHSDGHRLVGTLYLARGDDPKPTALLRHGRPGIEQNLDIAVAPACRRGLRRIEGAIHSFSWHRAQLREVLLGWLDESDV